MRPAALRAFYAASFVAFGLYLPYFPRWLEARGIRGAAMGIIAATFPATALVAPIALGIAADVLRVRGALQFFPPSTRQDLGQSASCGLRLGQTAQHPASVELSFAPRPEAR